MRKSIFQLGGRRHWRPMILGPALLIAGMAAGCASHDGGVEVDVRPQFLLEDRVALWPQSSSTAVPMPRPTEDFFIPLYMAAFPGQVLVERRDVAAVLGEQDVLTDRLDEQTRAKLRKVLGVKAVLFASITDDGFALKVIDTDTGAVTASVFVYANDKVGTPIAMQDLVRHAIGAMKDRAKHQKPPEIADHLPPAADTTAGAPAPVPTTAPTADVPAVDTAPTQPTAAIPLAPPPHD